MCGKEPINTVSQFQHRLFIIFSQPKHWAPPSLSLRIIAALFFVTSTASDSSSLTTQSSVSSAPSQVDCGFHFIVLAGALWVSLYFLVRACSPPPLRQLTFPRPPPASPLVGIRLSEVDCCLSLKYTITMYNLPPNLPPSPTIHHSPHHGPWGSIQCLTIAKRG